MSISDFNIYNITAAVAIVLIAAGMFFQHKNILYEDGKLYSDRFGLWSEIILMAVYILILPPAIEYLAAPAGTGEVFIEACSIALASFVLFLNSLLRFLKNKKKLQKENQKESI